MPTNTSSRDFDIAIIGMAGRFPGAPSIEDFWSNLCAGAEAMTFSSRDDLSESGLDPALLDHPNLVPAAAVLDGIDLFDSSFFGYSPREAELMDPQHRFALECAWEALENAGYDPHRYAGSIGVYAGTGMSSYLLRLLSRRGGAATLDGLQLTLGNDKDYLTTRISYKLDLRGPSVSVQTACSTSLVAVHLACQSLNDGECDMALAGGVSIRAPQPLGYLYQEGSILSPDGHCRAFDARARGTVFGNGVGLVVLKRFQDAEADRDYIYAVIKGSAVNNDGHHKVGFTAPSVEGQAAVIRRAMQVAGVDPASIGYVEAHGTGTALGDPIEIAALKLAFGGGSPGHCGIGSVKTNVGHLDTAAGIAGLIKTTLALDRSLLPPSLHFEHANPDLQLESSPFHVITTATAWSSNGAPRRAGTSSFGIGGTNAHVVLEEAPVRAGGAPSLRPRLFVLTARTETALERVASRLAAWLAQRPGADLADVAYTSQVGRTRFGWRRTVVAASLSETLAVLQSPDLSPPVVRDAERKPSVVFLFPGQGAQHVNMGLGLYQTEPVFRERIDACSEILGQHLGRDLRELLYPTAGGSEELVQTRVAQPALFAVEYALAHLWMDWGVRPAALLGHSVGEYVAACLAGVFSLEDALTLVAARGALMQQCEPGAMLAVALSEDEVVNLLGSELCLAAVNAPRLCVLSGRLPAVEQLRTRLEHQGVPCRLLRTSHAYHSSLMDPALGAFRERVAKVRLHGPKLRCLSNLTGRPLEHQQATDPDYWVAHVRRTVRFADALTEALRMPDAVLLEVGPLRTLGKIARQDRDPSSMVPVFASLPELDSPTTDHASMLTALGHLWSEGVDVDWANFHRGDRRARVPLPAYPFERQRFWYSNSAEPARSDHARQRNEVDEWCYVPVWSEAPPSAGGKLADRSSRRWLLFLDSSGFGQRAADILEAAGHVVVTVRPRSGFRRENRGAYCLDPGERAGYRQLATELRQTNAWPDHIVHFWNIVDPNDSRSIDPLEVEQGPAFDTLLFLCQEFGQAAPSRLRVDVVSNDLYPVFGGELLRPGRALSLGPCRVAPQEFTRIACRSFDIHLPDAGQPARQSGGIQEVVQCLVEELCGEETDQVVALRGKKRWIPRYEPVRLRDLAAGAPAFRTRGVYVITGGLGGLGLALAELLAESCKPCLALIGRNGLPERADWDAWLVTHPEQDRTSQRIRRVRGMEGHGAEVLVIEADVTRADQIDAAIALVRARFGSIQGALHLAGTPGGALMLTHSGVEAATVLAPKVNGALNLRAALKRQPYDFLVLFSSTFSITGGVGQVDYCAANAFLDALAHFDRCHGGSPTIAINWDGWRIDSWQAERMTVVPELQQMLEQRRRLYGIGAQEGLEILNWAIRAGLPQVIVSTRNLASVLADFRSKPDSLPEAPRASSDASPAGDSRIRDTLTRIWEEVLGVPVVRPHDDFLNLGGHSLLAIQVLARVREELGVELSLRAFFEGPTVAAMAQRIGGQSQAELDEITRVLAGVECMSPDQVRQQLVATPYAEPPPPL